MGIAISWVTLLLVVIFCLDVAGRKLFDFTKTWIMDLEWHLFALLIVLSAGYSLKHNRHVRVDLFYDRFPAREKARVNFWGTLVFLLPWCVAVIVFTFGYAWQSFLLKEGASEPGGLPARYIIKFAIVLGAILLLLQGIAILIDEGLRLRQKNNTQTREEESREII
jgi:TRAP-type mannitol/chloroaromatic compound transport system permease small subunit